MTGPQSVVRNATSRRGGLADAMDVVVEAVALLLAAMAGPRKLNARAQVEGHHLAHLRLRGYEMMNWCRRGSPSTVKECSDESP